MARRLMVLAILVGVGVTAYFGVLAVMGWGSASPLAWIGVERPPIVVGLLHSRTGPLAGSEKALIEAEMLAVAEINERGGVAGRRVEVEVADGRSDPSTFATQARRLIEERKAVALFGCWSSECRKAVREVVEERKSLLFFPGNYEGMERPGRTIYSGGSANQSVTPAVRWCFDTLKARRFFVVGNEEVWSRCAAEIAKDSARAAGAEVVGELFLRPSSGDPDAAVAAIRASGADVVLDFLVGPSVPPFLAALHAAGLGPDKLPTVHFGFAEDEARRFPPADVAGHYAGMAYFQGVDREEGHAFVRRLRARFGDDRVASDPIVAAYDAVILWGQAASEVGVGDPEMVLAHVDRQSLDAPEGIVTVDPESRVAWRPFHVGRARPDGQFDVVWTLGKPIRPMNYLGTRPRLAWDSFVARLQAGWGGRWSASGPPPNPTAPR